MTWITDWTLLQDDKTYIACPLYQHGQDPIYLGQPIIGFLKGWEVKRLLPKCYAAIELPPFQFQQQEND